MEPRHVPAWSERLRFIGADRLAVVELPGAKRSRLEIYLPAQAPARALISAFGGQVREVKDADWQCAAPGKPLSIAGRLTIVNDPDQAAGLRGQGPTLCIPAAMAFGAGDHATTAMCLRFLAEVARRRRRAAWQLLDLGAGSGILALAGRLLGAAQAVGIDNDPHAVRTAKQNAVGNAIRGIAFHRLDLIRSWRPDRTWEVVAANLFSGLILQLLPRMGEALATDGSLILSGILTTQAAEVEAALRREGFRFVKRRKGRWVAFLAEQ